MVAKSITLTPASWVETYATAVLAGASVTALSGAAAGSSCLLQAVTLASRANIHKLVRVRRAKDEFNICLYLLIYYLSFIAFNV
jgi:nitrate reductase gamma subunit